MEIVTQFELCVSPVGARCARPARTRRAQAGSRVRDRGARHARRWGARSGPLCGKHRLVRSRAGECQTACKPGSVPRLPAAMAIPLGRTLRGASSNQPGRRRGKRLRSREAPTPSLFGLAPGEVCRAGPIAGPAVRSYRTFSPLPAGRSRPAVCFSVALSRGSPPPGVTRHRFSVEPGLSSTPRRTPRPSGRLAGRKLGLGASKVKRRG